MIERSWKLFRNQKSAHFTTKTTKYGTSQCLEGCTQLQKWAIYKKTTTFLKKKTSRGPSSHAKMIRGLVIVLWRLQYMINLCAKKNFAIYLWRKVMNFQKTLLLEGPQGPVLKHSLRVFYPLGKHILGFLHKKKCSRE